VHCKYSHRLGMVLNASVHVVTCDMRHEPVNRVVVFVVVVGIFSPKLKWKIRLPIIVLITY